jgi:hypothetical protein
MEIKGWIKEGESVGLTCCSSVIDVLINEESLYNKLDSHFKLDAEKYWNDSSTEPKTVGLSFIILDEKPESDMSYNDLVADITFKSLYSDHVTGCYSEYTCGFGGFDFLIKGEIDSNEEGHSLFTELSSYQGKWVWMVIKSERSIKIDKFLAKNKE